MTANPGDLLIARYDVTMVVWSYLISVAGSFLALECAQLLRHKDGKLDWSMLTGAALMLGGVGIWTMHFIGMQAYKLDVPIAYDGLLTFVSLIAAIVISGLALYLAGGSGKFSVRGWVAGGVIAGLGVCVMHYMGMFAQVMRARMTWDLSIVGLSVVIAVVAALAALWLAFNVRQRAMRLAAAALMGVAVCTMHYTGMSAASMICLEAAPQVAFKITGSGLPEWTLSIALTTMALVLTLFSLRVMTEGTARTPARA